MTSIHARESVNLYAVGVLLNYILTCSGGQTDLCKQTRHGESHHVQCKFIFPLYLFLKIGECHML